MKLKSGWLFWKMIYLMRRLGFGELTWRTKEMEQSFPLKGCNLEVLKDLEIHSRKDE